MRRVEHIATDSHDYATATGNRCECRDDLAV
jgi:hypothetical protein